MRVERSARGLSGLVIMLAVGASCGPRSSPKMVEYRSDVGGFAALFPGTPREEISGTRGSVVYEDMGSEKSGPPTTSYAIRFAEIDPAESQKSASDLMAALLAGLAGKAKGHVYEDEEVKLGSHRGRSVQFHDTGTDRMTYARVFCTENRVFTLVAESKAKTVKTPFRRREYIGAVNQKVILEFLQSFRIFAPPGGREATTADPTEGRTQPDTRKVNAGSFAITVPAEWKSFSAAEAQALRQQYMAQSKAIYQQFSGADDQTKTVEVAGFHISEGSGSFVFVSFTVPPTSNLIALLKSQIEEKMAWGVREGHIRKYLGVTSVDEAKLSGFYTKTIGKSGAVEVSGGIEHKDLKSTMIQLTLLSPQGWDEAKATATLATILHSVALR